MGARAAVTPSPAGCESKALASACGSRRFCLHDVAVVRQTIEQRTSHLCIYQNARPFTGEGQIAEFIEYNEVPPVEIFGKPSLAAAARLGLKPVDEVDGVVEAAMSACVNATASDGYG